MIENVYKCTDTDKVVHLVKYTHGVLTFIHLTVETYHQQTWSLKDFYLTEITVTYIHFACCTLTVKNIIQGGSFILNSLLHTIIILSDVLTKEITIIYTQIRTMPGTAFTNLTLS